MSIQAHGKVAIEVIPMSGVCRPACHDSSVYLFVMVLYFEVVVLPQVGPCIFYHHTVHVYCSVYNHQHFLCDFIFTPICLLSSDSSCITCCNYCWIPKHQNMSPAMRRILRKCPSIFTPLFSQFNLPKNVLSNVAWMTNILQIGGRPTKCRPTSFTHLMKIFCGGEVNYI